jgi:hypothetical protein
VTYGFSQQLLAFAQTSVALRQHWRSAADREAFRVGAGLIVKLGR